MNGPAENADLLPAPVAHRPDDWGGGLAIVMDELAHGVLVASVQGRVLHANQAARAELGARHVVSVVDGLLQAPDPKQSRVLLQALAKGGAGLRSLVCLRSEDGWSLTVAVLPLRTQSAQRTGTVALVFSRASVCDALMLCFFARSYNLTNCEEQVLAILCQGYSAPEIALQLHVAVSTVRTHVRSLCTKTQSSGVRALVRRVAVLPPLGPSRRPDAVH
jgi:DNA-binding CsgD family transcriptional regulator